MEHLLFLFFFFFAANCYMASKWVSKLEFAHIWTWAIQLQILGSPKLCSTTSPAL